MTEMVLVLLAISFENVLQTVLRALVPAPPLDWAKSTMVCKAQNRRPSVRPSRSIGLQNQVLRVSCDTRSCSWPVLHTRESRDSRCLGAASATPDPHLEEFIWQ